MGHVRITDVYPDRAFYRPGEEVRLLVRVSNDLERQVAVRIVATVRFLAQEVVRLEAAILVPPGRMEHPFVWLPPSRTPAGYGVDFQLVDAQGAVLSTASTAFDVLQRWTQAPRYGFLTNFSPGRQDVEETLDWLLRYHINGLQFYDWMYRHEDLLTSQEPYHGPLSRLLSRRTVDALIDAAHRRNMAAMPYTAIYSASVPFYRAHPDWALYRKDGNPIPFGDNFLYIMNPAPHSPWTEHLMREFAEVMRETRFDGIHLDQYGDPKAGFDSQGNPVQLAEVVREFINLTRTTITRVRPDAVVAFNAVNNWPMETVALAGQDFLYIEVWPPHTLYRDLWELIVNGQELSRGKPVLLAVYIDPARERNVRLTDAVIFASGGYHIELGERAGMLADAYFPRYKSISPTLAETLRRYYDFAVRYENVLSLDTRDATEEHGERLSIGGVPADPSRMYKEVWPIVRRGDTAVTVNLINLMAIPSLEWNGPLPAGPARLENLTVRYRTGRPVTRVWLASPDFPTPAPVFLEVTSGRDDGDEYISFTVPHLAYWDMVVVEFAR